jgi:hypothetical protein
MEQQDFLSQENVETQPQEMNSGTSAEVQNAMPQEPTTPAEDTVTVEAPVASPQQDASEQPAPAEPAQEETVKQEPAEEKSAEEIAAEIDRQQNVAESEPEPESENEPAETLEQIETEYAALNLEQCVSEMERLVDGSDVNAIKQRVGVLRSRIIDFLKERRREAMAAYNAAKAAAEAKSAENPEEPVAEPEAPSNEPDETEVRFNKAFQKFKDAKAKFVEELEAQKQKNLEAKKQIIEDLRNLVETESNLKVLNDKFKEFQEAWKNIGPVPQAESTNLWQNYHFYVEKFFDILRMNKEMRALDLKKNLESKLELCEKAESLLLVDSINQSFKELQSLHEQWKEIGPVPEDKKEEVWERFKSASDQINARRKEFYDRLFAEEQNNYNAKVVLCEQAEEAVANMSGSLKEYNSISDKLTELLTVWKTLGPAPAKLNDEIWNRFKSTLDKFFTAKKEYFQNIKETQTQNYNKKLNLVLQAEGIADRTDWKQATDEMLKLQAEWKTIGTTPRKYSDQIWKRFRAACDKFFEAKSNYFKNVQEVENDNLKKKEELVQKILTHEFGDDRTANMEVLKAYQNEWIEIGFVPKKEKDKIYAQYREALDKRFAELKISAEDLRHTRFQSRIDNILNSPGASKMIDKEKNNLRNRLNQLREDIPLWENNLGFFANSKNAEIVTAEFRKKIEAAKAEAKDLEYKLTMMNRSQKKEQNAVKQDETPADQTAQTAE